MQYGGEGGGHRFMKVFHKKTVFFERWPPLAAPASQPLDENTLRWKWITLRTTLSQVRLVTQVFIKVTNFSVMRYVYTLASSSPAAFADWHLASGQCPPSLTAWPKAKTQDAAHFPKTPTSPNLSIAFACITSSICRGFLLAFFLLPGRKPRPRTHIS